MKWAGLNKQTGSAITDVAHIQQSIQDILTTPVGSRVMRRDYGSDLFELIDQPQNPALQLKLMAATVMALTAWEPRIRLTHISIEPTSATGKRTIQLTVTRIDTNRQETYQVNV